MSMPRCPDCGCELTTTTTVGVYECQCSTPPSRAQVEAEIIAWLRRPNIPDERERNEVADAIERGDHREPR